MQLPPNAQINKANKIILVALYVAFVPAYFDPKCQSVIFRHFGTEPLGIPAKAFFPLLITCLYLPAPWFLSHFTKIALYERSQDNQLGLLGITFSLLDFSSSQAPLFRSKVVSLCGIAYVLTIVMTWIIISG